MWDGVGRSKPLKTKTVKKTLSPAFDSKLKFEVYLNRRSNPFEDYKLSMKAMDKDLVGGDDLLGTIDVLIGSLLGEGWAGSTRITFPLCPQGTVELDVSYVDAALLRPPCAGLLTVRFILLLCCFILFLCCFNTVLCCFYAAFNAKNDKFDRSPCTAPPGLYPPTITAWATPSQCCSSAIRSPSKAARLQKRSSRAGATNTASLWRSAQRLINTVCIFRSVFNGRILISYSRILICYQESWFSVEKCWFYNKNTVEGPRHNGEQFSWKNRFGYRTCAGWWLGDGAKPAYGVHHWP